MDFLKAQIERRDALLADQRALYFRQILVLKEQVRYLFL